MAQVKVHCLPVGEMGVNCYLVENLDTHQCLLVDPGDEGPRILHWIGQRQVCAVLLTHGHFDHIGAVDAVCTALNVPLYVHSGDLNKLSDAYANVSGIFGMDMTIQTVGNPLEDGDVIDCAGFPVQVLHTPGHSDGSVCYLLPGDAGVLTGDTLFADGYGRTDFPDGSFLKLKESFRKLFQLSPQRTAWPGHGEPGLAGRNRAVDA